MKIFHKTDTGYIFDRRIFWTVIGIGVLIFFVIAYQNNFDFSYKFTVTCPEGRSCYNVIARENFQMYNPHTNYDYKKDCTEEWCKQATLEPGVYGTKPPMIITYFPFIMIVLVMIGIVLNHFIHNRGKKFSIKVNLPDKWIKSLKRAWDEMEEDKIEENKDNSQD